MNPITANSSMPPALNIQRSLYDFLCKEKNTRVPKDTLNVVGHFSPINPNSEFFSLMNEAGFEKVLQLSAGSPATRVAWIVSLSGGGV